MSRALVLLIWLRYVAGWATFWRSGRGSFVALLGKIWVLSFWLGSALGWVSAVWYGLAVREDDLLRSWFRSAVREAATMAPLPLLVFALLVGILSLFEKPFTFSPTEIDLLGAGPFSRRQLVNYKIGAAFSGMVLMSILVAPSGAPVSGVVPVFVGSLLLLNFYHLVALVAGSLGRLLGLQDARGLRRLAIMFAFVVVTLAISRLRLGKNLENPIEVYRHVASSSVLKAATAPLCWFVEAMLAPRFWPDHVGWASRCLLLNGVLFLTVHVLDARLEDRAESDDLRSFGEVDRNRSDRDATRSDSQRAPWALPLLSRCQGMSPIAWRQGMSVVRRPQLLGGAFLIYGVMIFMLFAIIRGNSEILFLPTLDGQHEINPVGARLCAGLAILLVMTIVSLLSFDFRGDMGQIDVLKALPIPPIVLAAGQLFVPVVIAAVMQWLALAAVMIALKSVSTGLGVAAAFVPPVSLVLIAIENLPAFWFPIRQTPGTKVEPFEMLGYALVYPLLRFLGYCAASTLTIMVAAAAYIVFGQRAEAALAAAWLTLAAAGSGLAVLIAHKFDRFDVARDVPA